MARQRKHSPSQAQDVISGSNLRMEAPKSSRQPQPRTASNVHPVGGFVSFLREHTVVTLAVGFAIATQAQAVIKQLIASFINPLYGLLFNGQQLSVKSATLHLHGRTEQFAWGAFVYALIDFIFVLAAIYVVIRVFNLDKLDKPKED
jgi:large-conductance mechanosensitive channel